MKYRSACALLMLATALFPISVAQGDPIVDRSPYYSQGASTTDDVRRIPVPENYNAPTGAIVLTGGRLFDGTGAALRPASVVIEGKKITAVLKPGDTNWPADAQIYDLEGKTVMPGLIDLHVHVTYVDRFGDPPALTSDNLAAAALRGIERMRIFATTGITSVRDVASHGSAPFILKDWQAQGRIEGPRIFPAGQLITARGGHGTENFIQSTSPGRPNSAVYEASGAEGFRDAVRAQFKQGADLIKIGSHFSQAEIDAAVDEAHSLGIPVAVDAETQYIDMAIKAGADTIEHPLPRSEEAIALMAKSGIASVPTLVPYRYIMRNSGGYFGSTSRRFTLNEETIFRMLRSLKRTGVKIGVGTDLVGDGNKYMPFAYIDELKSLTMIGYSNSEALVAATKTNSEILRMGDRLGTIQAGKLADVIVIDGDPTADLDELAKVDRVIVNGRIVVEAGRIYVPARKPVLPPQRK